jgi:hypothetical protein
MPAGAMTGQQSAPGTATTLDAAIASKLRQLAALKRDIEQWGCEFAADDASIEGCQQLDAKARMLEAEIEELKSRAGPAWTSETQKAAEASVPEAAPARLEPYTYRWRTNPNASYRTVCVRLCDGFYYPIHDASRPDNFLAEDKTCRSSCSAPARLFYQPLTGDDAQAMVALTGEAYADLPNAFRYRSEYVDACACKPKPWSAEAKAEYRRRAVLAARTEAERIVAAGTGETAKLLAGADLKVAERTPRAREAAVPRQPLVRGLFGRYRPLRYSAGGALEPRAQARYEPPQRRFFLFRNR